MSKILQKFNESFSTPSDINEHIQELYRLSTECDHITEMGVRWVVSTWAFLAAKPKKMVSYDISYHVKEKIDEVVNITKDENINFEFILADVLKINIEDTDLLFIDTLHTYTQLIQELNKHSEKIKKYIVLHDTTTFGDVDEVVYSHASDLSKNKNEKTGLKNAILEFLNHSNDGKNWKIKSVFTHNNGLTILERYNGTSNTL